MQIFPCVTRHGLYNGNHPNNDRDSLMTDMTTDFLARINAQSANEVVVINDEQFLYAMHMNDLRNTSEDELQKMDPDAYGEWCQRNPIDETLAAMGSDEYINIMIDLLEAGADEWKIA